MGGNDKQALLGRGIQSLIGRVASVGEAIGIAFVTDDFATGLGAFALFDGDPAINDEELFFSPDAWAWSTEKPFEEFNACWEAERPKSGPVAVAELFDLLTVACDELGMQSEERYLAFFGVDPADYVVDAESRFVERFNSAEVHERWKKLMSPG